MRYLPFLLLLLFSLTAQAEIYKWVDENGKVHFGDKPRQQKAINAQKLNIQTNPGYWQPLNIEVLYQGSLENNLTDKHKLDQQRIQTEVNWVYRFYDEVLYFDFYKKVPVKINVLKDVREYQAHVLKISGYNPTNSLGVYLPSLHEIAVYIHAPQYGGKEGTYATIRHEASHAILHSLAEVMPRWLNEGMAEQMETLSYSNGQFRIKRHQHNHHRILTQRNGLIPADEYIEVDNVVWVEGLKSGKPNQAMAGQLVFLSLSKSYGRSFITRLLQDYKRGVRLRSFYLLDGHYIGGASAFNLHWLQWLSEGMAQPENIYLP